MNTTQIFKKSWNLVWRYRALWFFGFFLALTAGNPVWWLYSWDSQETVVENRIILSDYSTIRIPGEGLTIDFSRPGAPIVEIEGLGRDWFRRTIPGVDLGDVWALLISLGIVVFICAILSILFRYTSQAALIRMVDENERDKAMVGFRRGLRLGWSRVAWKLFLIDLCITLPLIILFSLLLALAVSPLFLLGLRGIAESLGGVISISLMTLAGLSLFGFLAFIVAILLSITRPVMYQACGVDGLGVFASIRQGFRLLRTRFNQVAVTWLVWLATRLVWGLALIPAVIILSPVILLTIGLGVVIGAIPTLIVAGIAHLFVQPVFAWIIGVFFGVPLFFLIAFAPITFFSGLVEVLKSIFWTLSYREFRLQPAVVSQPTDQTEEIA